MDYLKYDHGGQAVSAKHRPIRNSDATLLQQRIYVIVSIVGV